MNNMTPNTRFRILMLLALTVLMNVTNVAAQEKSDVPDFTKDAEIPPGA